MIDEFFSRVEVGGFDDCAVWVGSRLKSGYGMFYHPSIRTSSGGKLAHRVAWEMLYGETEADCICHRCDNPSCVNPAHLFPGSYSVNMRDMISKGRHCGGPLTDEQADYLRTLPKGSSLPKWPGFTSVQLRNMAYWIRQGKTYAVHRRGFGNSEI